MSSRTGWSARAVLSMAYHRPVTADGGGVETARRYERWLAEWMPLSRADLAAKHRAMAESPYMYLRATFYRWAELWDTLAPGERGTSAVLGVGDLHVENFGTWRDADGRLVWGINDFDE